MIACSWHSVPEWHLQLIDMFQKSGLHVYQDSGAPKGSTDYTTLILLHGYAFHGGQSLPPFY